MPQLETLHPALRSLDVELSTDALLLTTKLALPVVRPGNVVRQRLVDRLDESVRRRVTLVAAPPGFGKTSLLSVWACRATFPVGWVSLDDGDNDPVRFWSYVITALDGAHPGLGAASLEMLRSPQSATVERALTLLLNALATLTESITLVLDDCHAVTAPLIYQSLAFVLDHLPPQLHLVLAGRVNPPLPLARLRARGELAEIRTDQLRFTVDEATALLRETLGLEIAAADIAVLNDRTEGWAAGLALAALSLQGQQDATRFVASLRGSDRFILDYLVDEVLGRQSPAVQEFLLHTSILERLCAELCNSLFTIDDSRLTIGSGGAEIVNRPSSIVNSQEMLEYLEGANLFTVPLDKDQHWYRYHQLFAEFLRARLQRTRPELVPELHRRAAAWYECAGMHAAAVGHVLALGDSSWAATLIEQAADSLIQRGEVATLIGWLESLPASVVRVHPRLCLNYALALAVTLRFDEVERWLAPVEQSLADTYVTDSIRGEVVAVRTIMAALHGDVQGTLTLAREALAILPVHNPLLQSAIACILALGYMWNEHVSAEERALITTAVSRPAEEGATVTLRGAYGLASLWALHGRLRDAVRLYRQALPVESEPGVRPPPLVSLLYGGLSAVLLEQNDLAHARRYAQAGIELGKAWEKGRLVIDSMLVLARVQQAQGDERGARDTLTQAEQQMRQSRVFPWITNLIAAAQAHLDLAQGRLIAAGQWAQAYERMSAEPTGVFPVPTFRRATIDLILARVYLAQGRFDAAQRVLSMIRHTAEANEWHGILIAVLTLEALALEAQGNREQAATTLVRVLTLAEPEGYVRVFADEGAPMRVLLTRVASAIEQGTITLSVPMSLSYIQSLLAALPATPDSLPSAVAEPVNRSSQSTSAIEALSERELEVLHLLATGLSNHDVARTLVISVATVKTHIINIYSKLGVHSRTQAVARARELALV